jgi:Lrp/AsnC family transcriptional regulator, leucine-responsive regulatory protein
MAFDPTKPLDDVDWQILEVLQEDGRISFSELGRKVAMSAPAVTERVRRLEDAGVINGYRAQVDLERLGRPIVAVVRSRPGFAHKDTFEKAMQEADGVLECVRVTGEDCYVTKVCAGSMSDLESIVDVLAGYGETTTSLVLSVPVSERVVRRERESESS